ncbi:MAG: glycosyltransferase [Muribaculaceae bacterium]
MRLSIIIPVYNVEAYLERCVHSILAQSLDTSEYEILLINDGSTDRSGAIAENLAAEHPNIKVFHQENQGQSVARNLGLHNATGNYIWFIDSDDYIINDHISEVLNIAESKGLDMINFWMDIVDRDGNPMGRGAVQPLLLNHTYSGKEALMNGLEIGGPCTALFSKKLIDKHLLRFYPGISQQDVEFNTRIYSLAEKVYFTDSLIYRYFKTGQSTTTTKNLSTRHRLLMDNAIVTRETQQFAMTLQDLELAKFLVKRANSIIVGNILALMRDRNIPLGFYDEYIARLKEYELYPIKGKCLSSKASSIKYILNITPLVRLIIKKGRISQMQE